MPLSPSKRLRESPKGLDWEGPSSPPHSTMGWDISLYPRLPQPHPARRGSCPQVGVRLCSAAPAACRNGAVRAGRALRYLAVGIGDWGVHKVSFSSYFFVTFSPSNHVQFTVLDFYIFIHLHMEGFMRTSSHLTTAFYRDNDGLTAI